MKTTPMIEQYLSIKNKYKDAILLYRMGDFYEMFFEDANVASRALEIALTSRNKKDKTPVPMCGVPYKAVDGYIAKLIKKGFKVAICDQTEDSCLAKGLVKREVVRVVTPGMILDSEMLDPTSNNFLIAIYSADNLTIGLSCLDISTALFKVTQSEDLKLIIDEAVRINPSEVLLPLSWKKSRTVVNIRRSFDEKILTYLDDPIFEYKTARERLTNLFRVFNLEGFGCQNLKQGISAAGALIHYASATQKQAVKHLTNITAYNLENYLIVDDNSTRNLELLAGIHTGRKKGSLLGVLDNTITSMGGRLLKDWIRYPLKDSVLIKERLRSVKELKEKNRLCIKIRESLKTVYDLERLSSKISMGRANARDLIALKKSLKTLPEIREKLSKINSNLLKWDNSFDVLQNTAKLIEDSIREDAPIVINEGGLIKKGYNRELDELINISQSGKGSLAQLEVKERKNSGINSLKVKYNKVFGYYIEVPKSKIENIPSNYIRKQTLVNAERYITEELKVFEAKVLGAEEQRASLELKIFNSIRESIAQSNPDIKRVGNFIARLDCLSNLGFIANQNNYHIPQIVSDGKIQITDARHPVIEKMIAGERFVPNSISLDNKENRVIIITGPNMAGKSTILRQVALIVIMAQMGSFVPGSACISLCDRIFTRIGASDNLSQGQSTFLVEMQETANILNCATEKSLVIMDEVGRGTSTFDGLSIAKAVAESLHDLKEKGVKTLFATHYHELTQLSKTFKGIQNFNIAVKESNEDIIFLRKLVKGGTDRSYGIQVAKLAGIPDTVIKRAKSILADIEDQQREVKQKYRSVKKNKGQTQLELFSIPDNKDIIRRLREIDITNITPLDALNILGDLRNMIIQ